MPDLVKKILIVEDDDLISQMYLASLAGAKFEVKLEKDGESGWKAIQTWNPSLVILDIMLPKLSGLEILDKMKGDPKLRNISTIVMSSLGSDSDKQKALAAGAKDFWLKSEVNMADFQNMIKKVMQ